MNIPTTDEALAQAGRLIQSSREYPHTSLSFAAQCYVVVRAFLATITHLSRGDLTSARMSAASQRGNEALANACLVAGEIERREFEQEQAELAASFDDLRGELEKIVGSKGAPK